MADPFVPVHLSVNWFIVNSSSLNRGASLFTVDETCSRPRGEQSDRPGNTEKEEKPISATLLGYEILKEREKFTLRELFPGFHQVLPPKRRFKDNYDGSFLEKRRLGLQTFLESLMLHKHISTSEPVRYFLSVDDPLSPFYSTEESRVSLAFSDGLNTDFLIQFKHCLSAEQALCETLEQKNHRLLRELLEKQREVDSLTKSLEDKENYIALLWRKGRALEFHPHKKEDTRE
ncbi:sorting nexin-16-like isoform X1 [Poecilia reticulata]|uniref:sorting nexin-16-like isoform X1 n=1 Tax=Poecilia reticulata TaxID=8081 RepID=UPI0007EB9506|nr:PREDICTED: sorting nexin-16-like isoform X1 [Poecilia reticulata]